MSDEAVPVVAAVIPSDLSELPRLMKVLVVDDSRTLRRLLIRELNGMGITQITEAGDGNEALTKIRADQFDLVLLDMEMPDLDGLEVLKAVKADPDLSYLPVIMVSSVDQFEKTVECVQLGAEDYLPKPFNPILLRARVFSSFEKKRLRDLDREHIVQVQELNLTLENRVREQLSEIDRLGVMKRFFSPQIVKSMLDRGGDEMLKTHRREVVVVFLDMRGFTSFTDKAEPEEVMQVLTEFHGAMGPLIVLEGGTLERFAGDGIMIYFNDPIPMETPLINAVRMALGMQRDFVALRLAWRKRGFDLDLGIGIALGYATLGSIGFDGRWDYACIGSVTNHSARLCGGAKGGQILTNQKTFTRLDGIAQAEPLGSMDFKGVVDPVPVFNVIALHG